MAYSLVNALRRNSRGYSSSSGFMVCRAGSSVRSMKHSSMSSHVPVSRQRSAAARQKSGLISAPVGLWGLHSITASISGPMASSSAEVGRNPSSRRREWKTISQPAAASACSYSAKPGASSNAFFGRSAPAKRNSNSAAPSPQAIQSAGTPSASASAAVSRRHRGSG